MSQTRRTVRCGLLAIMAAAVGCADNDAIEFCSLINLIATPDKYHGKRITTFGVASIHPESTALYLNEESLRLGMFVNAISLEADDEMTAGWRTMDERWVVVEGVFDRTSHGHLGLLPGTIREVAVMRTMATFEVVGEEHSKLRAE